jgi:hypothetical protein
MKTWTKVIVTGLLMGVVIMGSLPALANPYGPYYDRRARNQQYRIYHGYRSGRVTPGEFRRLDHQRGHIQMAEARWRGDGRMNHWGRLNRMERHSSRNIYRYHYNNWRPGCRY